MRGNGIDGAAFHEDELDGVVFADFSKAAVVGNITLVIIVRNDVGILVADKMHNTVNND